MRSDGTDMSSYVTSGSPRAKVPLGSKWFTACETMIREPDPGSYAQLPGTRPTQLELLSRKLLDWTHICSTVNIR
ncbi:hypothetical protein C8R48DRAFT_701511 [Suillus tomentosus]|nr:hypothetical protein C8R48DRAFT_701511 [Suillus tomentosus]